VTLPTIAVHGHRGARAVRPENTIAAFEYAIEAGADALELDVVVTKDNVVVVSHDPFLNPKICTSPGGCTVIRQVSFAQLREWDCGSLRNPVFPRQQPVPGARIPSLEQVFGLASRGGFLFNVEIKSDKDKPDLTPPPVDFAQLVMEAVRKFKLEERLIVQSFDYRVLHEVRKIAPQIRLSALYAAGIRNFVDIAREGETGIVGPHYLLVSRRRVEEAHCAGLQVIPWTANRPKDWDRLIRARVDAIITDDPAGLIHHLKEKNLQ
jgi:glycerophosphoryl diester phosphodiesterase